MNIDRPLAAVPTLTEVVARAESTAVDVRLDEGPMGEATVVVLPDAQALAPPSEPTARSTVAPAPRGETQFVHDVLADVQRQVELMLEYRMRESLAPILARATDMMIRDARSQLANTLHEMVARAVAQEMARHRDR